MSVRIRLRSGIVRGARVVIEGRRDMNSGMKLYIGEVKEMGNKK